MKTCFKCCESKPLTEYYKHPRMADGHLNKCKACTKKDVHEHRNGKGREKILAYDRDRANNPDRVAARAAYAASEAGKEAHKRACKKYHAKHPKRKAAHHAVSNAIRDGRLVRLPCFVCGQKAEAHHPDYDQPLDVVWLCRAHHQQAHAIV